MSRRLIECVPNFSEGRNLQSIRQITDVIEQIEGVKLLNVDSGFATNRTVVTFVGEPEKVVEAAFLAIKKAAEVIDMRHHTGEHPRMGATDVCPLIPISGVSMVETVKFAQELAKRVGDELQIPVYCYEKAARVSERKNLANCRKGEYEGLKVKIESSEWKPDFGPAFFSDHVAHTGATAIGARDFLIAINYNLNTTSTRRANAIAFDVREKGRKKREGASLTSKVVKDQHGNDVWVAGTLKGCKAIGWYIEEYGIAQVSMNVTDINATPVHIAFDEVASKAAARGIRVTGSEIVGLVPKKVLLDAGKYYLAKQSRSAGISEEEIIKIAVKSMGLDNLKPFNAKEKVIEYLIEDSSEKRLVDLTCTGFAQETASESTAPGGGSVSAYMGALGAALGTMVANLSSHKAGWDLKWDYYAEWAEKGQKIMSEMLYLVDEDTNSFKRIIEAFGLPKSTEAEKEARTSAIQAAIQYAIEIPLKTMQVAYSAFDLTEAMVKEGNPTSVSDAGVGALALRAAIFGGYMNVKINSQDLKDRELVNRFIKEAQEIMNNAIKREQEITSLVFKTLDK
ncbi:MAG: glutamate formimidoyltransferase [Bacteroidales bacterium]|nr:glutamate formimidoyltransferase [Bacteroidales bacterium]MDD4656248.1 glutamate formimidoyltransferase [Bacteroidales bacterium]